VDHSCYRCGASVEEGVPFCPECRAPQICVNIPGVEEPREEPHPVAPPATLPFPPGTPGEIQPPAQRVALPTKIRARDAIGPGLAASIVMIVALLLIRIPAALILITTAAGGLAVFLFKRRSPHIALTARNGARVGMMSGLFSFGLFVMAILFTYFSDRGATFREMLEQLAKRQPNNPAAAQMISQL